MALMAFRVNVLVTAKKFSSIKVSILIIFFHLFLFEISLLFLCALKPELECQDDNTLLRYKNYIHVSPMKQSLPANRLTKKVRSKFGGLTSPAMRSRILMFFGRILRGVSKIKLRSMKATSFTYKSITYY
jgi:hypothetical protein